MNNFREWLSDNLRYILLAAGLLVVLVGLFFGVRVVSRNMRASHEETASGGSVQLTANTVTVTPTASPAAVSSAASAAESVAEAAPLTKDAVPAVTKLMTSYYEAVGSKDVAAVKKLTDTLPEAEAAKISSSSTTYSDVEVYSKPGKTADSYVVYTKYHYTNAGSAAMPGLSQSYVRKEADGQYKIVFSDIDKTTADYIDQVTKDQDVQDLISEVKKEYEKAAAASKAAAAAGTPQSESSVSGSAGAASSASANGETDTQTADTGSTSQSAPQTDTDNQDEDQQTAEEQDTDEQDDGQAADEGQVLQEDTDAGNDNGEETGTDGGTRTGTILSTVNVRSGPGFEYEVISEVAGGSTVTVVGDNDKGWWHVITDSAEGYVGQSYISVS